MRGEKPAETLDYYTLILSKVMREPLGDAQRRVIARHVERSLPVAALNDLCSQDGMTAALTAISDVLGDPRVLEGRPVSVVSGTPDPS